MYGKIVFEYDDARVKHDEAQTLEFDIKITVSSEQELPEHKISHCNGWKAATHGLQFFIISNMLNIVNDARNADKQDLLNSGNSSVVVYSEGQKRGMYAYIYPLDIMKKASREIVFFEVDDAFKADEFSLDGIKADPDPRSVLNFSAALEKMKSVWTLSPTEDEQEDSENTHLYVQFTILETVRTCHAPSMDDTLDRDYDLIITVVLSRVDESTKSINASSGDVVQELTRSLDEFANNYDLIQLIACDHKSITSTIQSSTRVRSNVLRIDLSEGPTPPTLPIVMDCPVIVNKKTLLEEKESFSSKIKESVTSHLHYKTITLQNTEVEGSSNMPSLLKAFFAFKHRPPSECISEETRNQAGPSPSSSSSQADALRVVEGDYVYLTMHIEEAVSAELADEYALVTDALADLDSGSIIVPTPSVMYEYAFSVQKVEAQSSESTILLSQAQENLLKDFATNLVHSTGSIYSIRGQSQKFQLPCDTTFDSLNYKYMSITCKKPSMTGQNAISKIVDHFKDVIAQPKNKKAQDFFLFKKE